MIATDKNRDIQKRLDAWGGWAASGHSHLGWERTAAGFRRLLPISSSSRMTCSDDEGLLIDGCVVRLKGSLPQEYQLIVLHYILNQPKRQIARALKMDEKQVRVKIGLAESFVSGCLAMLHEKCEPARP